MKSISVMLGLALAIITPLERIRHLAADGK